MWTPRSLARCARLLPRPVTLAARPVGVPALAMRRMSTNEAAGAKEPAESEPAAAAAKETVSGPASTMEFQAETKKLLNIVANSLYTDKEVFVRELISNASDALEKRRYALLSTGESSGDAAQEMGITITTDKEANTLTIQDNGVGMSRDELVENLGTIARSGTKSFAQQLAENGAGGGDAAANVIGQFGVGFYAVFMVAEEVTVFSKRHDDDAAHCWSSTGDGSYELAEASDVPAGTKIVLKLKPEEAHFASRFHIEQNIRKYSNFVGFPIAVDGERVNTIDAIWMKSKNEVRTLASSSGTDAAAQPFLIVAFPRLCLFANPTSRPPPASHGRPLGLS